MLAYSYVTRSTEELRNAVLSLRDKPETAAAHALLFQLFTSCLEERRIREMMDVIDKAFPGSAVLGASTSGEVSNGAIYEETTILSVFVFQQAGCKAFGFAFDADGEQEAGRRLYRLAANTPGLRGIEILANTKGTGSADALSELDALPENIAVFGGGADAYNNGAVTVVFQNGRFFRHGMVGALYTGDALHFECLYSLGWKPLGKKLTATQTGKKGYLLRSVDGKPAIALYKKYLNFHAGLDFHAHVDVFPIMVNRNGHYMARVPLQNLEDGAIELGANIQPGESIYLGYVDPRVLLQKALASADRMAVFQPQALLLFICITRKSFLKDYAASDAAAFAPLAPASGFYTYGEILRLGRRVEMLNCTVASIGIREGDADPGAVLLHKTAAAPLTGHMSTLQRMVCFAEAMTEDLKEANRQLQYYAQHDKLTGLLNRGETESQLENILAHRNGDDSRAFLVMFDVDNFKQINDTFGHDRGDAVLRTISGILREKVRAYDFAGRWGGEEFMLVLPAADVQAARLVADRIRTSIAGADWGQVGPVTVSAGVCEVCPGETASQAYKRVDKALYEAKARGKNQVVLG